MLLISYLVLQCCWSAVQLSMAEMLLISYLVLQCCWPAVQLSMAEMLLAQWLTDAKPLLVSKPKLEYCFSTNSEKSNGSWLALKCCCTAPQQRLLAGWPNANTAVLSG
jgi:hypothetical protein